MTRVFGFTVWLIKCLDDEWVYSHCRKYRIPPHPNTPILTIQSLPVPTALAAVYWTTAPLVWNSRAIDVSLQYYHCYSVTGTAPTQLSRRPSVGATSRDRVVLSGAPSGDRVVRRVVFCGGTPSGDWWPGGAGWCRVVPDSAEQHTPFRSSDRKLVEIQIELCSFGEATGMVATRHVHGSQSRIYDPRRSLD